MTAAEQRDSVTFFNVVAADGQGRREEQLYLGRVSAEGAAHDLLAQGYVAASVSSVAWDSEEERAILDSAQNIVADARDAREALAFIRCVVMGRLRGAEVEDLEVRVPRYPNRQSASAHGGPWPNPEKGGDAASPRRGTGA